MGGVFKPIIGIGHAIVRIKKINRVSNKIPVRAQNVIAVALVLLCRLFVGLADFGNDFKVRAEFERLRERIGHQFSPLEAHLHRLINHTAQRDQIVLLGNFCWIALRAF